MCLNDIILSTSGRRSATQISDFNICHRIAKFVAKYPPRIQILSLYQNLQRQSKLNEQEIKQIFIFAYIFIFIEIQLPSTLTPA